MMNVDAVVNLSSVSEANWFVSETREREHINADFNADASPKDSPPRKTANFSSIFGQTFSNRHPQERPILDVILQEIHLSFT